MVGKSMLRGRSARVNQGAQQIHYLHRRFNGSDIDQTALQPAVFYLGVLPADSLPLETYVRVNVAFTTGNIIAGTSTAGSSGAVVSSVDVIGPTSGMYVLDRYMGTYTSVDVPLYIQTDTSGATVTGQVDVWQAYIPIYPTTY